MIPSAGAATSCFPINVSQGLQMYQASEDVVPSSLEAAASGGADAHSNSLLYSLTLLKDKVHQVQSLLSILVSPDQTQQQPESTTSIAIASMGTIIQEIIVTASSMMFACQQMAICGAASPSNHNPSNDLHPHPPQAGKYHDKGLSSDLNFGSNRVSSTTNIGQERGQSFISSDTFDWFGENYNDDNNNNRGTGSNSMVERRGSPQVEIIDSSSQEGLLRRLSPKNYDIIELDAADLLAKYTHYCHVCGKGFKRDANLRMHMRAHGDEYKTSAALSNPKKKNGSSIRDNTTDQEGTSMKLARKYSCPQEGCRWNQKHAKFQPLKSMICVKNHYKRSHCPKMYVCKRCNRKQFSVLSDLRTHEKHCGDVKWQCSCGTTFSRKDKLLGHVALFVGHTPAINTSLTKPPKVENQAMQMQMQMQIDR